MVDQTATARIERLVRWLERFKSCFGHRAQLMALRTYVQGVFSVKGALIQRRPLRRMGRRLTWRPRVPVALLHGSSLGASTCDAAPSVERWQGTGNRGASARTRHPPATNSPAGN